MFNINCGAYARLGSGCGAVVERSLPISEIRGSDPVIVNIIYYQLYWKDENEEKRGRERPDFLKNWSVNWRPKWFVGEKSRCKTGGVRRKKIGKKFLNLSFCR